MFAAHTAAKHKEENTAIEIKTCFIKNLRNGVASVDDLFVAYKTNSPTD